MRAFEPSQLVGTHVEFSIHYNITDGRPQARNVRLVGSGATSTDEWYAEDAEGRYGGTIRVYITKHRYGFITCPPLFDQTGHDVYLAETPCAVLAASLGVPTGEFDRLRGAAVRFRAKINAKGVQAEDIVADTAPPPSRDYDPCADAAPAAAADPPAYGADDAAAEAGGLGQKHARAAAGQPAAKRARDGRHHPLDRWSGGGVTG